MAQGIAPHRKRQVPAEDTPAFGAIAERFRRAGDLDRAVALCQEGLAKFPDHLSARVTLGWSLLDLGRYEEAREALEGALKRAPDNLAAIRGLAELHDRAEHTMPVSMDGPGQWPPEPSTIDNLHVDPAADTSPASAPADVPLKGEALSLDALLSRVAQKGKAKGKGKKGKDAADETQAGALEPLDVLINPASAEAGAVPELIQSNAHRNHQTSEAPDLNALIDEIDQVVPAVPAGDDAGIDLGLSSDDADIEKALQQAQAAAEQAAADAVATRKAAEEQAATDSKARKAAEEKAAEEAAARKAAEERAAAETAARKAAEEKAAAEVKARKAAEEKAAAEKAAAEAAAKKAAEKAAQETAARKAAEEKAAAEAAAKKAAEEKAAAEAAAKKAAEQKAAAEAAAKAAAEKAAAEEKARKAAEQKAAAEAAARKAAEEKTAAEAAARQAAEKAAAEAAKKAAEDRATAEAAAARAAEERAAAAEAAARKAAEEKAEAEAAARQAAKAAAAETEARKAAEERAATEAAARVAAEQAALDARPALKLTNPTVRDFPDPQLEIRAADMAAFEASESAGLWEIPLLDSAATEESADIELEQLAVELSATLDIGPTHPALPALESLLRRVETRRSQLMSESVA